VEASVSATRKQSRSFSITHGPAISESRRGELNDFQMAFALSTQLCISRASESKS
jgi:hypothetical protein